MPSNTYTVVTTRSFLSVKPFDYPRNRSCIRKMPFHVLGESSRVGYKAFCTTVLNKLHADTIITLLPTFITIEEAVTKQILQYLVTLSLLKTALD